MGHLRKLRFASILAGGLVVAGGTGVAMAQGGISANLALSGTVFDMTVTKLVGDSSSLFVGAEKVGDGNEGVSKIKFSEAVGTDVCMSAPLGSIPGLGPATFKLETPGESFRATNLLIGAKSVDGGLTLNSPQIGVDANQVDSRAAQGSWGLAAAQMIVENQKIEATSVAADQITIAGAKIAIHRGEDSGC